MNWSDRNVKRLKFQKEIEVFSDCTIFVTWKCNWFFNGKVNEEINEKKVF